MKEEIIKDLANAKNNRFVFLFNITNKDGSLVGNYSLQNNDNYISLVRNDIYDNGARENKRATYELVKGDKFPAELIDYMTSEMQDEKELLDFYDLLGTNKELAGRDLEDLNVKSYMVHSKKSTYKGKTYTNNFFRENIYNSEDMTFIAERQLKTNVEANKYVSRMDTSNSLIALRKSQMHGFVLTNLGRNKLFTKVAAGQDNGIEEKTPFEKTISTAYDKYTFDKITSFEESDFSKDRHLNEYLNNYLGFRDTFQLMKKYQSLRDKEKIAKDAELAARELEAQSRPAESFQPKVKQLDFFDLLEQKKNNRF